MPSIKSNFSLTDRDIDKVLNAIKRTGTSSENTINDYLHGPGKEKIVRSITNFIPVSKKGKKHARFSNWYKTNDYNLAVEAENSLEGKRGTSFYYLYYIVTGTGTSKKKGKNDFMKKGMSKEYDTLVNDLITNLDKNIEKEMK